MLSLPAAMLVATSLFAPPTPPPDSVTAFLNVTVIPMDRQRVLTGQTVLVRNGRIVELGPAAQVSVPPAATRIDGQGKFLIPGLADMHVHLSEDSLRSERTLVRQLARGVTTVRVMSAAPQHLRLRARALRGEVVSPRLYLTGPAIDELTTPDQAKRVVAEQQAAGYDFLLLQLESATIAPEVFDTFVAAAHRAGLRLASYTPRSIGLTGMLAVQPASIEWLSGYLYIILDATPSGDGIPFTAELSGDQPLTKADFPTAAAATQRAGVWNCPVLTVLVAGQPGVRRLALEAVQALHNAGAGLLFGTDFPRVQVEPRRELAVLVAAGLTPYQALQTATRNPALFLGTLDSTGTVEIGKRADLVLLAANPLVDVNAVAQPVGVMLGGRWLARAELERRLGSAQ